MPVNRVLMSGRDFDGHDVTGEFGRESKFARSANGAVFGHKNGSSAGNAFEHAEKTATSTKCVVIWIELLIHESSPASEMMVSFGSSANSRTGMVVPVMRLCIADLLSSRLVPDARLRFELAERSEYTLGHGTVD